VAVRQWNRVCGTTLDDETIARLVDDEAAAADRVDGNLDAIAGNGSSTPSTSRNRRGRPLSTTRARSPSLAIATRLTTVLVSGRVAPLRRSHATVAAPVFMMANAP